MREALVAHVGFDRIWLQVPGDDRELLECSPATPKSRPFLKWAGGKQWLVPLADHLTPLGFTGRYIEPFLGGGAVFFALQPERSLLTDTNDELVATYQALKDDVESVIAILRRYPHTPDFFQSLRSRRPRALHTRAARFIYLNKTAFNGLYRVNRSGRFNVPFGNYSDPTICNLPRLRSAALALRSARVERLDFAIAANRAKAGDLVYFDPPYITGHSNNGFLKYNARLFSWDDQTRLARLSSSLYRRGVHVVISNADHPEVRALYTDFYCYAIERRTAIAGGQQYRGSARELLLTSFPLGGSTARRLSG